MLRRTFVGLVATAGTMLATRTAALAQTGGAATTTTAGDDMASTGVTSGYAPVNGLQLYYEIHGAGEPLVLLHGAYGTIDMWGPILSALAANRRVIAVELQGHGRTADIDRPLRYEQLADDVAGLMAQLGIAQADVGGYSLGGAVALQVAMRHPDLVRKLVAISGGYRSDGMYPEVLAGIQTITPETFAGTPMEEAYLRVAPNPNDWPTLIEKLKELDAQPFAWSEDAIRAIPAPALVVSGDADVVRPEHSVALLHLLGGGVPGDLTGLPKAQLAILPGTTHIGLVLDRAPLLLSVVEPFLAAPMPDVA